MYPSDATAPMLVSSLVLCLRLKYFKFMFQTALSMFTVYGIIVDKK